ncbi:hypothetical protein [Nocardioides marmoriginsengisoli]|nr:hypothetical protein [Nocardioides marmoriginsengisoli]
MFLRIQVLADDSNALAVAEQALMFESYRRNLLTWTPPDGAGEPCVFTVVMSSFDEVPNDLNDLRVIATYGLKIQAEPYVRAQTMVSATKSTQSGTQVITSIDACTSATGWAFQKQPAGGPPTSAPPGVIGGGWLSGVASDIFTNLATRVSMVRTGLSTSLAGSPYIRIEATSTLTNAKYAYGTSGMTFKLNGIVAPVAVQEGNLYWFDAAALGISTLNSLEITVQAGGTSSTNSVRINAYDVSRSNMLGTKATNRQLSRILQVAGSARTQGSLVLSDETKALGTALIYTCPATPGLEQPSLRRLLTSGNSPTVDSTLISGFSSDINTLHTFDVPTTGLPPGGYLLLARLGIGSVLISPWTITWAAKSRQAGVNLPGVQTGTRVIASPPQWDIYEIGTMTLPPRKMGSGGLVRIELSCNSSCLIDEAWLFNIDTGRLTRVECGTGAPTPGTLANRLWLDSPTLESPVPTVWLGTEADRSDSYHAAAELKSFGNHEFVPPEMNVFTVTSYAQETTITLSHYPRFHTRVAAA